MTPTEKQNYIIGIDPDVDKSGVALLDTTDRSVQLQTLTFSELNDWLQSLPKKQSIVVVEAGWLNEKSSFKSWQGKGAERIAKNVGSNHQVGKLIIELCQHYGIEVIGKRPLIKHWSGKDGKITHDELACFVNGLPNRTNQEQRDAVLLAWDYANFPIKIKPIKAITWT